MIFYINEKNITEFKPYTDPDYHIFNTLETWTDYEFETEEEAVLYLNTCELGKNDKVVIQKVYMKE
jgi:hypothetical protein